MFTFIVFRGKIYYNIYNPTKKNTKVIKRKKNKFNVNLSTEVSNFGALACSVHILDIDHKNTYSKVGGSESVGCGDSRRCCGVGVVSVDVGQQCGHHCWDSSAQVLCGETVEVPGRE